VPSTQRVDPRSNLVAVQARLVGTMNRRDRESYRTPLWIDESPLWSIHPELLQLMSAASKDAPQDVNGPAQLLVLFQLVVDRLGRVAAECDHRPRLDFRQDLRISPRCFNKFGSTLAALIGAGSALKSC